MSRKLYLNTLPKCGAAPKKNSTRTHSCRHIALKNGRCYYHGGRRPTHGKYMQAIINQNRENRQFIRSAQESLKSLTEMIHEGI